MPACLEMMSDDFQLPAEPFTLTIEHGKITHFHGEVGEGGGLKGILGQLGLGMPG